MLSLHSIISFRIVFNESRFILFWFLIRKIYNIDLDLVLNFAKLSLKNDLYMDPDQTNLWKRSWPCLKKIHSDPTKFRKGVWRKYKKKYSFEKSNCAVSKTVPVPVYWHSWTGLRPYALNCRNWNSSGSSGLYLYLDKLYSNHLLTHVSHSYE